MKVSVSKLQLYNDQIHKFNDFPTEKDVGMIRVNCNHLKKLWSPIPKERLKFVQGKLPAMALQRTMELMEQLSVTNEKISKVPGDVKDFVQLKTDLQEAHAREEEFELALHQIEDMFQLVTDHKIRMSKESTKNFNQLKQLKQTLATNRSISDGSMDDAQDKFTVELKESVVELVEGIKSVGQKMDTKALDVMNSTILKEELNIELKTVEEEEHVSAILMYIKEQENYLVNLMNSFAEYNEYEKELNLEVTELTDLADIQANLGTKKNLWQSLQDLNQMTSSWKLLSLNEIVESNKLEDLQTEIKAFFKLSSKSARSLSQDHEVVCSLKDRVAVLKKCLPVVEHLTNKALSERHWDLLNKTLQTEQQHIKMTPNMTFRVSRLSIHSLNLY